MYNVTVWHNILWSRYKGEVFSSLWNFNAQGEFEFKFIQMAETELDRTVLSSVDLSNHRYQYDLMFKGALDNVPFLAKIKAIFKETLSSQAQLHILTSYEKLETILQMLLIKILGKKFAVFCDSTIHDNPQRFFKGLVKAAIFRSADGIFGYGQRSREYVMHYGASDDKIFIRCQAAALPHDYDREKVAALRLREQSPTPRFLFVGRLHAQKDLPTLILAFSKYLKEKGDGQLVLIGKGPEEDALRALVAELGI